MINSDIHQLLQSTLSTTTYYNFTNIRYGAPPIGSLRFNKPQPPESNRSAGVQDGSYGYSCYQASPQWVITAVENLIGEGIGIGGLASTFPIKNQDEDCLFLDVFTSKEVFDGAQKPVNATTGKLGGAPVLIWIFGGGFTEGDKTSYGPPIGLLDRSRDPVTGEPFVYVSMNYRVSQPDSFITTLL
jgi:carboxylesterase type B